ncbi:MAG: ABC transporter permease [Mycobacterium leprae]
MKTVRLYFDLLWLDLYARTQYRADFVTGIFSSMLQHAVTLGTLWLIFARVSALGGWSAAQAAVLYALFSLVMGLVNALGSGVRQLPNMVEQGDLDNILILPASPYIQLLPRFNPFALGDLLLGVALLAVTAPSAHIRWTPPILLYLIVAVVCGVAIQLGLLTVIYSASFWLRQPAATYGAESLSQLARYPAGIFPRWVQILITWVFPVAFASVYPAGVLTGAGGISLRYGLVVVPVAAACIGAGALVWRLGLRKYEGTGS